MRRYRNELITRERESGKTIEDFVRERLPGTGKIERKKKRSKSTGREIQDGGLKNSGDMETKRKRKK